MLEWQRRGLASLYRLSLFVLSMLSRLPDAFCPCRSFPWVSRSGLALSNIQSEKLVHTRMLPPFSLHASVALVPLHCRDERVLQHAARCAAAPAGAVAAAARGRDGRRRRCYAGTTRRCRVLVLVLVLLRGRLDGLRRPHQLMRRHRRHPTAAAATAAHRRRRWRRRCRRREQELVLARVVVVVLLLRRGQEGETAVSGVCGKPPGPRAVAHLLGVFPGESSDDTGSGE